MKLLTKRIVCLLLTAVMVVGFFPASALAARGEVAETPLGDEVTKAAVLETPQGAVDSAPADLAAVDTTAPTLPGYTQITSNSQLVEGREYLIVAKGATASYALYPRTGTLSPGSLPPSGTFGNRVTVLTVDNGTVTAKSIADGAESDTNVTANVEMSALHLTVAPQSNGKYQFASAADSSVKLNLNNAMFGDAYDLTVETDGNNTGAFIFTGGPNGANYRKLSLAEHGTEYKFSANYGTDFWGPTSKSAAPIYIYVKNKFNIPGYNQVTETSQLVAGRQYLVVGKGINGMYALYPRTGTLTPGELPPSGTFGDRVTVLTVDNGTVTAKSIAAGASSNTNVTVNVAMDNLLLTVAPQSNGTYQFASAANSSVKLNLGSGMFTDTANNLTVTAATGSTFTISYGSSRTLSLAEHGTEYKFSDNHGTDFWGPTAKSAAPIYIFIQGDLPEPVETPELSIDGYTRVTSLPSDGLEAGDYLIIATYNDSYYMLYPGATGLAAAADNSALLVVNAATGKATGYKVGHGTTYASATAATDFSAAENTITKGDSTYSVTATGPNDATYYLFNAGNGVYNGSGPSTLTIEDAENAGYFLLRNNANNRSHLIFFKTNMNFNQNSSIDDTTYFGKMMLFKSNISPIEKLRALVTRIEGEGLTEADYTPNSWGALQTALTAARAVITDDNAAGAASAMATLQAAWGDLRTVPVVPTVPAGATKIEDWHTMVPAPGTSKNEPYKSGTAGSNKFRIPAIITLKHQSDEDKNGRLVSAIDARWNHTGDACGLDTIASYSDDNGANWNYLFPNYFGDSTNAYATYGASFIDPVLLEGNDGTIYLMVDIWPGGIALNTAPKGPAASSGCEAIDGTKRLVLYTSPLPDDQTDTNYDYYVGDFADGYAPVYEAGTTPAAFSGYYIDEYYYLYFNSATTFDGVTNKGADADKIYCQRLNDSSQWVQQNVFFYNSTLHVRAASYLWIMKSTDGGESWGDPQMINAQVHPGTERFYGVGPGAGLCMTDGTLILPIYIWPSELAGFIYSKDNGATWHPSPNYATTSSDATSESCLVQIDENTVRHFYRESWKTRSTPVAYTDHTWNSDTQTWTTGSIVRIEGVNHYGACQVSAIKYSRQVDGKDLILYSTPTGGSRASGVVYALLVNNDEGRTMELYKTYSVNDDQGYAYSSLTETKDNGVALLYESTNDAVIFKRFSLNELLDGSDLAAVVRTAETKDPGAYTEETLTPFLAALDQAKTDLLEGNKDNFADDKANLETTMAALVEISQVTIRGTVKNADDQPVVGAAVILESGTQYQTVKVNSVAQTATTDAQGAFEITGAVADGLTVQKYSLRVSAPGYQVDTVPAAAFTAGVSDTAVTLERSEVPAGTTKTFAYDMTEGKRPGLEFSTATGKPTVEWPDDSAMKLKFTSEERMTNLVKLTGTGVKNGTIEFDATREGTYTNPGRFGLALRLTDNSHWAYIGQFNSDSGWGHEYWNITTEDTSSHWTDETAGPSFGKGDTRHFKVTINEKKISLEIDGVPVITDASIGGADNPPMNAADAGFVCGNNATYNYGIPSDITIDNLYIYRQDPTYAVTLGASPALQAKISSSAEDSDLLGNDHNQAAAGDTIKITATGLASDKTLGAVTVTETDGDRTVTATLKEGSDGENYFTFQMPDYAVTVAGTEKNSFTAAQKNAANQTGPKVDRESGVTLTPSAATVTYQWYRVLANGTTSSLGTGAAYTPVAEDAGKTLRVVVTGTGEYAGIHTVDFTPVVADADARLNNVVIQRDAITMWANAAANDAKYPTGATTSTTVGANTILTAAIDPNTTPGVTYAWTVEDASGAALTLEDVAGHPEQRKVTATGKGSAVVRVTATDSYGDTKTDTVRIDVKLKATGIELYEGSVAEENKITETDTLIIHANETDNTVTLIGKLLPEGAEGTINWARKDGKEPITSVDRTTPGQVTITATNATTQKLGHVEWWASWSQNGQNDPAPVRTAFVVEVHRKLASPVTWSGDSSPKVNGRMSVQTDQLKVYSTPDSEDGDSGKAKLSYAWYALDTAEETTEGKTAFHTGTGDSAKTFTLTSAQHGKYIKVVVSAALNTASNFFYEGSVVTPASGQVGDAEKPAKPTGTGVACTTEGTATGKITNLTANAAYNVQYRATASGSWGAAESKTAGADGAITGLAAGQYRLQIPADVEGHVPASDWSDPITVASYDPNAKTITVDSSIDAAMGSVVVDKDKAVARETVTITVTPKIGYKLKEGTVPTVTGATVEVQAVTGQEGKYTFTMPDPAADLTVSAQFEMRMVHITHDLDDGLSCDMEKHDVQYSQENATIVITADAGHAIGTVTVTKTDGGALNQDYYQLDTLEDLSKTTIKFPNGITDNITVKVTATARTYTANYRINNLSVTTPDTVAARKVTHGGTYTTVIAAAAGYTVPDKLEGPMTGDNMGITVGGADLTAGQYTYTPSADKTTATIVIANVTGDVLIKAEGVKIRTPISGVTVTIGHHDSTAGNSQVPHVGDTLTAEASPENADVVYEWYHDTVRLGTGKQYTLKGLDLGAVITVKAVGQNDYSGERSFTLPNRVENFVVAVTKVELDKTTHSTTAGQLFTLTATVEPDNATDKTITWEVLKPDMDEPADNVVIQEGQGALTATFSARQTGTVRVRARTSNGRTANCTVTIERPADNQIVAFADNVNVVYDGQEHHITVNVTRPDSGYEITYADSEDGPFEVGARDYSEVGEYTVYYRVTADHYEPAIGSAKVIITVDKAALAEAIADAGKALEGVTVSAETDPANVTSGTKFTTQEAIDALKEAIEAAELVYENADVTPEQVEEAETALSAAIETFQAAVRTGTKSTSRPSSTTSPTTTTETRDDGAKVTTVTKPDGSKVETVEQADGSKTEAVTSKDGAVTITAVDKDGEELAKVEIPATIPESETKFEDLDTVPWAEEAVNNVAALELVKGTGGNKYTPAAPMTRGSLATVLHRLSQGKSDYNVTFKDVAQGKYYTEGVAWAAKANVVKGISEDVFAPDDIITREQLAVMLARYAKLIGMDTKADSHRLNAFADGDATGSWAVDGVAWCVANGILKGKGQNNLDPTAEVSRAEVAVMLDRFIALIRK